MIEIKTLAPAHEADWRRLWAGFLKFHDVEMPEGHADRLFARLTSGAPYFAFAALDNDAMVGFVHALPHASTWAETDYCFLEDLYVDSAVRGRGVGSALIKAVYDEADKRGLAQVYWQTLKDNTGARRLYDKLATLSDFVQYRRR